MSLHCTEDGRLLVGLLLDWTYSWSLAIRKDSSKRLHLLANTQLLVTTQHSYSTTFLHLFSQRVTERVQSTKTEQKPVI